MMPEAEPTTRRPKAPADQSIRADEIHALVDSTRAEVKKALRARLKEALLASIFGHALEHLPAVPMPESAPAAPSRAPSPESTVPSGSSVVDEPAPSAPDTPTETDQATRKPPSPSGWGYYVYGVMTASVQPILPDAGIDGFHPVYAVPHRSIQALVSKVSMDDFGPDVLQDKLDDLDWVEAMARQHHSLQHHAQGQEALVPMRLGTICSDDASLHTFLDANHDDFVRTLDVLDGAREWTVRILCDAAVLDRQVRALSTAISAIERHAGDANNKQAFRDRIDRLAANEAGRLRTSCREQSHAALSACAKRSVLTDTPEAATASLDGPILEGAYLVARHREADFEDKVALLRHTYQPLGIDLELTGPWLPYSFADFDTAGR